MIKKSGDGFVVKSESGKNLSQKGLSRDVAEKRLAQVEHFKQKPKVIIRKGSNNK